MGPLADVIELNNARLSVGIVPELGAGLAWFDIRGEHERQPLFRSWPQQGTRDPVELACFLLVPWSGRISEGGFSFDGAFHALDANMAGEPCPIHGNAWQRAWQVDAMEEQAATMSLISDGPGPFEYRASLRYAIDAEALSIALSVRHRGSTPLPYGVGFHPWFPRSAQTRLRAPATSVWLENNVHLPTEIRPVDAFPYWDFRTARDLPEHWINNGFNGWSGEAEISWPDRGVGLAIHAEPPLTSYIMYSPDGNADFFCFEPV
ncbi:MAG: aldose 1-epimerase, partial [Candidatus Hydrogenedentes bacterium]|nr:aldose 1-epimerase [Candidatus Hydrogenedentota bacterium]